MLLFIIFATLGCANVVHSQPAYLTVAIQSTLLPTNKNTFGPALLPFVNTTSAYTNASTFPTALFQYAYPSQVTNTTRYQLFGKPWPTVEDYAKKMAGDKDAIFNPIARIDDVVPGDMIAATQSGHLMFVREKSFLLTPIPPVLPGTEQWALNVTDCRAVGAIANRTIRLYVNVSAGTFAGYASSLSQAAGFETSVIVARPTGARFLPLRPPPRIRMASFNVQVFGQSKVSKEAAMKSIVRIFRQYDLTCMMEIRDAEGTAFPTLLARLNQNNADPYDAVLTSRRGKSDSKEQEAYVYRRSLLEKISYWESNSTAFERPPGAVSFRIRNTTFDFVHMCEHIRPSAVITEMNALKGEYEAAKDALKVSQGFLSGDFNAGCSYLSNTAFSNLALVKDASNYAWVLPHKADTTVAVSSCPYDRIVVDAAMMPYVDPSSARVDYFDKWLSLSQAEAAIISDHYPVALDIIFPGEHHDWPYGNAGEFDEFVTTTPSETRSAWLIGGIVGACTIGVMVCALYVHRRRQQQSAVKFNEHAISEMGETLSDLTLAELGMAELETSQTVEGEFVIKPST